MDPTLTLILSATLALLLGALAGHALTRAPAADFAARRRALLPIAETVVLNTSRPDDQSLRGALIHQNEHWLVLANAERLTTDGAVAAGGELWVPRARVSHVQVVASGQEQRRV